MLKIINQNDNFLMGCKLQDITPILHIANFYIFYGDCFVRKKMIETIVNSPKKILKEQR